MAKRKPKKRNKVKSDEPDGDYQYMDNRKKILKGKKKKLREMRRHMGQ